MFSEFQLLDAAEFELMVQNKSLEGINMTISYDFCEECGKAMIKRIDGSFECSGCGLNRYLEGEMRDCNDENENSGTIHINDSKGGYRSTYNICTNYSRTQRKTILDQLNTNNSQYSGPKIPKDVLAKSAEGYNKIQKLIILTDDTVVTNEENSSSTGKKFVKRGNIKDEVLSALIYYECIRADVTRKKKDIAEFMKLSNNGFSRGEDILRTLHHDNLINALPTVEDPIQSFTDRYIEALGLETKTWNGFVVDLVNASIKKMVGVSSIASSKVVGAIYILITKKKLDISIQDIEDACDNIRKNTFVRYAKEILSEKNIIKFVAIFEQYEVPHGYEGRIKKKV